MIKENIYFYSTALHEEIFMPDKELPINFLHHLYNQAGQFCIPHWHSEIEIVYVCKGVITSHCNSQAVIAHPGDLIFVNPTEIHDYHVLQAPIELKCCTIGLPLLSNGKGFPDMPVFENLIRGDQQVTDFFLDLWDEGHKQRNGFEYAIRSDIFGILATMMRAHIKTILTGDQYQDKTRNLARINEVFQYIEQNYRMEITLDSLAAILNLESSYFCRLFKGITGTPPIEYLNNFRIYKAISLMQDKPELSITQIASATGYNDSTYFSRVFKHAIGESPSSYRTKITRRP